MSGRKQKGPVGGYRWKAVVCIGRAIRAPPVVGERIKPPAKPYTNLLTNRPPGSSCYRYSILYIKITREQVRK